MTKLLLSSLLFASVVNATELTNTDVNASGIVPVASNASTRDSGWYAGVGAGIINWGGSLDIEVSNGTVSQTFKYDGDMIDSPLLLKVGYVTESENRVEFYYKKDAFEADESGAEEMFESSTFGINYQWAISSLSSKEMLPYIRIGLGFGSASSSLSDDDSILFDDGTIVELDLGAGVHYEVIPNLDVSVGIYRRAIINVVENIDNSGVEVATSIATNGIEIGATYHF